MTATTIIGIILFLAVLALIGWLSWKIGKQNAINAKEYDRRYILCDIHIDSYAVNETNHDYLLRMLDGLRELKYKDTARTIKLIDKFNAKFEPEASRIMKEYFENNNKK